ncbi:MAG: LysR family transcriptional regulator [Herminiimonas sp.]|nr:LysR family transcriptional regulator [Herminiimonas sp.]
MIRYFRTFLIAAETLSFSAAGSRLGLTQSAVSTQIRRLEQELGCLLFERTGKSVTLSVAGSKLLPDATHLLELFETMKEQGKGPSDTAPIDLGAISTVQAMLLPKALVRFRREQPAIHVNIVPGMSVQLLTQVDARELDIAVMIKPRLGIPSDLKWITLMREHYVGIAPVGAPRELKALFEALPFIRYSRRSHGGQLVDRFLKRHGLWVKDGLELDEPSVILNMVSEGLGCSIIPGKLVPLAATPGVAVLPLPGPPLFREIGILVRLSALKRASAVALITSLTAEAGAGTAQ